MEPEVVISVKDVFKSYKVGLQEIPVLKGVNVDIRKGDFTIIIGPSGSGKSTLLHSILGLETPTSGTVIFLGTDLYALPSEDDRSTFRKQHIGMVYQQPNWIKSLTVVENVAFPLALLGIEKSEAIQRAWTSLQNLNMQKWVGYLPTELSGGQQQKVALARALVTDPAMIIADEPTGNLDYESGQDLMQLLVKFNSLGKTIIMVTHDLEYLKYCKTAVRIKDGQVIGVDRDVDKNGVDEELKKKFKRGAEGDVKDDVNIVDTDTTAPPKPEENVNVVNSSEQLATPIETSATAYETQSGKPKKVARFKQK